MKVSTLIENRPSETDPHLVAEWGLSLHIASNGRNILFDTGRSGAFAENAERMSVAISAVDAAVLSHHHFDHGGGLGRFFELNSRAKVHLANRPDGDCFGKVFGVVKKYVGLDKATIAGHSDRFAIVKECTEILPDVFLLPHIAGDHPQPAGNKHLFLKTSTSFVRDDFAHEVVMAIRENGKLTVFTGCSHHGVLNMVETVARQFRGVPIKAVIGGFHLVSTPPLDLLSASRRGVEALGRTILESPIEMIHTGHCTGTKAFKILKDMLGDRLADMRTGTCFDV